MADIRNAGISEQQLLAVWSTDADTGFTSDQLLAAGVPGYLIFNEVCNIPLSVGTSPAPTIRLLSTNLNATNTQVVLEGRSSGSQRWTITGFNENIFFTVISSVNDTQMSGGVTGRLLQRSSGTFVATLSIPLPYVFSNLTVTLIDSQAEINMIQLCPGR